MWVLFGKNVCKNERSANGLTPHSNWLTTVLDYRLKKDLVMYNQLSNNKYILCSLLAIGQLQYWLAGKMTRTHLCKRIHPDQVCNPVHIHSYRTLVCSHISVYTWICSTCTRSHLQSIKNCFKSSHVPSHTCSHSHLFIFHMFTFTHVHIHTC